MGSDSNTVDAIYGSVSDSKEVGSFDITTYIGSLEHMIYEMKVKWPDSQMLYVVPHKMSTSDMDVQSNLRELTLDVCIKWEIAVLDLFSNSMFDTNDSNMRNDYTFDTLEKNGLPGTGGLGAFPNLVGIDKFYLPMVIEALKNPELIKANKSSLIALITTAKVEAAKSGRYTSDSIDALKAVIEDSEDVVADDTVFQSKVDAQVVTLQDAINSLVLFVPLDTDELIELIHKAKAELAKITVYTTDSLDQLDLAIKNAERIATDITVTQTVIDAEVVALQDALDSLVHLDEKPVVDKDAIIDLIDEGKQELAKDDEQ